MVANVAIHYQECHGSLNISFSIPALLVPLLLLLLLCGPSRSLLMVAKCFFSEMCARARVCMILMNIECFRFQVSFHFVKSERAHAVYACVEMFDFGNE